MANMRQLRVAAPSDRIKTKSDKVGKKIPSFAIEPFEAIYRLSCTYISIMPSPVM